MRFLNPTHSLLFISLFLVTYVTCWESYELDLFDLVEEIGENFYDYFGVSPNVDSSELRKTYRKLSLVWHPDKNQEPGAEQKFRHIVGIYEVLKDEVKRARYDEILENGLPDWRQPIYYFRRVRKLSTTELAIAISIIISIGHYFVLWAQHFEKKLTLEDRMDEVRKRLEKKQKKKKTSSELDEIDASLQECYNSLPTPTLKCTLPYRFTIWMFKFSCSLPFLIKDFLMDKLKSNKVEVDDTQDLIDNEKLNNQHQKSDTNSKLHLSLNPKKIIEKSESLAPVISYNLKQTNDSSESSAAAENIRTNKEWTDKEKADLIKAITKFPAGTPNRWSRIGEVCNRSAQDCAQMEKQMKSNLTSSTLTNLNAAAWNQSKSSVQITEEPTQAVNYEQAQNDTNNNSSWTQEQQTLFEKALKDIGKDTPARWDKIAEAVPGKTKEDCINRFKLLVASVKKK